MTTAQYICTRQYVPRFLQATSLAVRILYVISRQPNITHNELFRKTPFHSRWTFASYISDLKEVKFLEYEQRECERDDVKAGLRPYVICYRITPAGSEWLKRNEELAQNV